MIPNTIEVSVSLLQNDAEIYQHTDIVDLECTMNAILVDDLFQKYLLLARRNPLMKISKCELKYKDQQFPIRKGETLIGWLASNLVLKIKDQTIDLSEGDTISIRFYTEK